MAIVSHNRPFVVGVDTHARTHTFAILVVSTGEQVASDTFPATTAGMNRAIDWAARRTGGDMDTLWVVEGIGSYGAGIARAAAADDFLVVEALRMDARSRRGTGKSDPIDAHAIAAAVLPLDEQQLRHAGEDDGVRAALRVLVTAREQMTTERTANINALTGLVRAVNLGIDARNALTRRQILEISRWRARDENLADATARAEAVRLARRITDLSESLRENQTRMTDLIQASPAAPLLRKTGIGPLTVAVVLTAWFTPGESARKPLSPRSPASARSPPHQATPSGTA